MTMLGTERGTSLRAEALSFRYRRRGPWVLREASLSLAGDEVVGLRGPSGSGKSTLARLLAGLLTPVEGAVAVDGVVAGRGHPVQLVMQHAVTAMNPRWRISEILAEPRSGRDLAELTPALVDPAWLDRFPHEVSGGQLQRINLARALLADPAFIVADEITASLDPITQARIWQLLLAQALERGIGVLVISHDDALLKVLCDRVLDIADLGVGPV
ncbi:ABC transporter ATP-binding protein [Nocardioides sp. Bht2]|uniref:ABC transporter ATP-binding protein n=1 Tax=Nocardioides sp. Bht2 TaxID=3392297 RepID=UPI0039B4BDED